VEVVVIWLMFSVAMADPCPDIADTVLQASLAFEDAEVDQARGLIDTAMSGLSCQTAPIDGAVLADLYGFDAVVSYSSGDDERTDTALTRLRTAFPQVDSHPMFGPELVERSDAASMRAGEPTASLTLVEGRRLWVDGQAVQIDTPLALVPGMHLLQSNGGDGVLTAWMDVQGTVDAVIDDGVTLRQPRRSRPERPERSERPARSERVAGDKRGHRGGLLVVGALTAAAGGGALVYGWQGEQSFNTNAFDAAQYGDCALVDACYADARISAIRSDANRVRIAYIAGYALTALGVGIVGTELLILPQPKGDGGTVGLRGTF
jgi:hypothetical protein